MLNDGSIAALGEMIGKSITSGVEGYQGAVEKRRSRARQNLQDAITFLSPEMAGSAFDEMVRPDPVSLWTGLAKPADTSKQRSAITDYIAMKKREAEDTRRAKLLKAAGLDDAPVQFDTAPVATAATPPAAPMVPPIIADTTPAPIIPASAPMPAQMAQPVIPAPRPATQAEQSWLTAAPADAGQIGLVGGQPAVSHQAPVAPPDWPIEATHVPTKVDEQDQAIQRDAAGYQSADEAKATQNYVLPGHIVGNPLGLVKAGNIDLTEIAPIKNDAGKITTADTYPLQEGGKFVLLPLVANGEAITPVQAVDNYHRSGGKNLGTFATEDAAKAYGTDLHKAQFEGSTAQPPPAPERKVESLPAPIPAPAPAPPATPAEPEIIRPTSAKIPVPGLPGGWLPAATDQDIEQIRMLEKRAGLTPTRDFSTLSRHVAKGRIKELRAAPPVVETHFPADPTGRVYKVEHNKDTGETTTTVILSDRKIDKRGQPVEGSAGVMKYDPKTKTFSMNVADLDVNGNIAKGPYLHTETPIPLPPKPEEFKDGVFSVTRAKQDPTVILEKTFIKPLPKTHEPMVKVDAGGGKAKMVPESEAGNFKPWQAPPQPPALAPERMTPELADRRVRAILPGEPEKKIKTPYGNRENPEWKNWDNKRRDGAALILRGKPIEEVRKKISAQPLSTEARQLAEALGFDLTGMA